ncbi:MAG: hypothetical protein ACLGHC_04965 [Alphaproteobacteria bacterium]
MARNNRGGRNNNPEGRNQYSSGGWMDTAKEKPFTTAAAAAAAVGAGVFLWSKRNQISGQISRLSEQITDWADEMRSGTASEFEMAEGSSNPGNGSARMSSGKSGGSSTGSRSSTNRTSRNQSQSTGENMNPQTGETIAH